MMRITYLIAVLFLIGCKSEPLTPVPSCEHENTNQPDLLNIRSIQEDLTEDATFDMSTSSDMSTPPDISEPPPKDMTPLPDMFCITGGCRPVNSLLCPQCTCGPDIIDMVFRCPGECVLQCP